MSLMGVILCPDRWKSRIRLNNFADLSDTIFKIVANKIPRIIFYDGSIPAAV
jgi:hypothetical protein